VQEAVVFHSGGDALLEFQGALPFTVIADPEKKLYAEFGVAPRSGPAMSQFGEGLRP